MFPYMYGFQGIQYIIPALLLSLIAQGLISSRYSKYRSISNQMGITGAQVANAILRNNGIDYMPVKSIRGTMTDHFDPRSESISLSEEVYNGTSIASISIAAHEVGHAIQYSTGYFLLRLRAALVPITNFATQISFLFLLGGMLFNQRLATIGIFLFGFSFLFQVVTLPVEINASRRALNELEKLGISDVDAYGSEKMLSAAALTYVAAMASALGQLLRLISIFGQNNNRR